MNELSLNHANINSNFYSLTALLQEEKLELVDFIKRLAPLNDTIQSLQDLAHKIKRNPDESTSSSFSAVGVLVKNLIFKQFPRPAFDAIREIISNALDAHVRAKKENDPIIIEIKKHQIKIKDIGDGIGWTSLLNFFVPGRSSNPQALCHLEKGISKVTGRFGQGGLSPFYFLYSSQETINSHFLIKLNSHSLNVIYLLHNRYYEASFTNDSQNIQEVFCKRKIKIETMSEQESIKMNFKGIQNHVFVNLKQISSEYKGTEYTITSDLLESPEKINAYVCQAFRFVTNPIIVNGKQINEKLPNTLTFQGGTILYSSEMTRTGVLHICENGKLIIVFHLNDYLVPRKIVLNFDQLSLTQERASLDFKNQQNIEALKTCLDQIFKNKSLSLLEKGALLNGLYPILGARQFNLLKKVSEYLVMYSQIFLPDDKKLIDLMGSHYIYLNPHFLSTISLPCKFEKKDYKFYFLPTISRVPFAVVKLHENHHIFLNTSYFDLNHSYSFDYNLCLFNQWLKNQEHLFSVEKDMFFPPRFVNTQTNQFPLTNYYKSLMTESNFRYYENLIGGEWIKEINDFTYYDDFIDRVAHYLFPEKKHVQKGFKGFLYQIFPLYPECYKSREKISQRVINEFINDCSVSEKNIIEKFYKKKHLLHVFFYHSKKIFAYINDLCLACPDLIDFVTLSLNAKNKDYIISNILECEQYQVIKNLHFFIIKCYESWRKKEGIEKEYYVHFLNSSYIHLFEAEELDDIFNCLLDMVKTPSFKNINILKIFNPNIYDDCEYVIQNLNELKDLGHQLNSSLACHQFIQLLGRLKHVEYLSTLSPSQFENFLEVLPTEDDSIDEFRLSLSEYKNIQCLSQRKDVQENILKKWVHVFLSCCQICEYRAIPLNTQALFQLIDSFLDESHYFDEQKLNQLIVEISNFRTKKYLLNSQILTIISAIQEIEKTYANQLDQIENEDQKIEWITYFLTTHFKIESLFNSAFQQSVQIIVLLEKLEKNKQANEALIKKVYRYLWESAGCISTIIRPFIYALLIPEIDAEVNQTITLPVVFDEKDFIDLHKDPIIIQEIGSTDLAAIHIQRALKQTNCHYSFISEVCKNSLEAGATQIAFNVYAESDQMTTLVIQDNGQGMDLEGLKALRIPNYTTKRKELKNSNFGWGFFTVFRYFDEAIIISSADALNIYYLHLKKTNEGLKTQLKSQQENRSKGTIIILRKRNSSFLANLVKINSELISSCQYMKNIKVFFQGQCINEKQEAILEEETLDGVQVQIGFGEEGIYCEGIRLSNLSYEMLMYLADPLKKFLREQQIKIRLFLPYSEQIMNRRHLIDQDKILVKSQVLIFKAIMKTYIKCWIKDSSSLSLCFNIFSDDYWVNFRAFRQNVDKNLQSVLDFINNKNPLFCLDDLDKKTNQIKIIQQAIAFFNHLYQESEKNSSNDQESLKNLISELNQKSQECRLVNGLKQLSHIFSEESQFTCFITWLPFDEKGNSFRTIRESIIQELITLNILNSDGSYQVDWLQNRDSFYIQKILEEFFILFRKKREMESSMYDKIFKKFEYSIVNTCLNMQIQQVSIQSQFFLLPNHQVLKNFLEKTAKQIWNQEITIQFYAKADGANAYTYRASSTIYVNVHGDNILDFLKLCDDLQNDCFRRFTAKDLKIIMSWIQTLAHELTHIKEVFACQSTHDAKFRSKIADHFLDLFISKDSAKLPLLEILRSLISNNKNYFKKRKLEKSKY